MNTGIHGEKTFSFDVWFLRYYGLSEIDKIDKIDTKKNRKLSRTLKVGKMNEHGQIFLESWRNG